MNWRHLSHVNQSNSWTNRNSLCAKHWAQLKNLKLIYASLNSRTKSANASKLGTCPRQLPIWLTEERCTASLRSLRRQAWSCIPKCRWIRCTKIRWCGASYKLIRCSVVFSCSRWARLWTKLIMGLLSRYWESLTSALKSLNFSGKRGTDDQWKQII